MTDIIKIDREKLRQMSYSEYTPQPNYPNMYIFRNYLNQATRNSKQWTQIKDLIT